MKKKTFSDRIKKFFFSTTTLSIVLVLAIVAFANSGVASISKDVITQQQTLLLNAVTRSAVQCYAIEGVYPDNVEYLKENYHLVYDEEQYVIHYEFLGGNLLPQMSVFYIGDTSFKG